MIEFIKFALVGWIPLVLVFFALMQPLRAVLVSFLAAWLFLPMGSYMAGGVVELNKMSATSYGVLIGVVLFDATRLFRFRLRALDFALLLWCLMPLITGAAVGLRWRLNFSMCADQFITWALPWFIGRLYLIDLAAFKETAVAIFVAGLVYMPFCWYELIMSPQLHRMVYGEHQHSFAQHYRLGGWRPMVFMQHGLMVAAWMTSATLVGTWLWLSGALRRVGPLPIVMPLTVLLATAILCKSLGALLLLLAGLGALFAVRYLQWTIVVALLALIPPVVMAARIAGKTTGDSLVAVAAMIDADRAESLKFRLTNEDILMRKALTRPALGWGWGGARVYNEYGTDTAVTDGMWIIYLGSYGLVGLCALYACLLLPPALAALKTRKVRGPPVMLAPILSLCTIAILFAIDTIPNSMLNPIFTFICGGLVNVTGIVAHLRQTQASATYRAAPTHRFPVAGASPGRLR